MGIPGRGPGFTAESLAGFEACAAASEAGALGLVSEAAEAAFGASLGPGFTADCAGVTDAGASENAGAADVDAGTGAAGTAFGAGAAGAGAAAFGVGAAGLAAAGVAAGFAAAGFAEAWAAGLFLLLDSSG